jgi:hypothetical protein
VHSNLPDAGLVGLGADSIEHGQALGHAELDALGARGGAWTPTLSAMLASRDSPDPPVRARAGELRERLRDCLPYAVSRGVRVLAGTDVAGTIAGEVALLAGHGLSPGQAIAAAGSRARDFLGIHPEGDIVTYDADPREDPRRAGQPRRRGSPRGTGALRPCPSPAAGRGASGPRGTGAGPPAARRGPGAPGCCPDAVAAYLVTGAAGFIGSSLALPAARRGRRRGRGAGQPRDRRLVRGERGLVARRPAPQGRAAGRLGRCPAGVSGSRQALPGPGPGPGYASSLRK